MTGSEDKAIYQFEVESGRLSQVFDGHAGGVISLALNANDDHLFSGAGDCVVMEWDTSIGAYIRTFEAHTGPVTCISLWENDMFTGIDIIYGTLIHGTLTLILM